LTGPFALSKPLGLIGRPQGKQSMVGPCPNTGKTLEFAWSKKNKGKKVLLWVVGRKTLPVPFHTTVQGLKKTFQVKGANFRRGGGGEKKKDRTKREGTKPKRGLGGGDNEVGGGGGGGQKATSPRAWVI